MSDVVKMKWHLNNAFKDRAPKRCISFQEGGFYIKDDTQGCEALLPETVQNKDNLFEVNNPNSSKIAFFKVDKCFFGDNPEFKRCDCILFDETEFCFLEMKFNSTTIAKLRIESNRKEAVNQLRNTIQFFNAGLDNNYLGRSLEGYVCTPEHYPNKDTSLSEFVIEFLEDYGVNLFEKNEKTFQ